MAEDGFIVVRQRMMDRALDRAAYHEQRLWDASVVKGAEYHLNMYCKNMAIAEECEAQIVAHMKGD